MALDFPSNPTNGQIYGNYYYDAATASWRSNPLVSGSAFISDNAPAVSPSGSIWYNSNDGTMFVRYGEQWVEARSNQKIISGSIVQTISSTSTNSLAGTIGGASNPSSTDGTQFHTFSFTPKFANSKLLIQSSNLIIGEYSNTSDEFYMAAYYDTTRAAIVAASPYYGSFAGSLSFATHAFNHLFDSWGTTAKTIQIRVGSTGSGVGSLYVNQNYAYNGFTSGARNVSFTIMEVAP